MGRLPWCDVLEIISYDLWLLTLWSAILVTIGYIWLTNTIFYLGLLSVTLGHLDHIYLHPYPYTNPLYVNVIRRVLLYIHSLFIVQRQISCTLLFLTLLFL